MKTINGIKYGLYQNWNCNVCHSRIAYWMDIYDDTNLFCDCDATSVSVREVGT